MEKLSNRKSAILEVLDEQIEELEEKLRKAQPLIDELNQLRRTRATLLSERSVTGGISSTTRLTMEQVVHAMQNGDGPMKPTDLAAKLGVNDAAVRSHLHRHKDVRYRQVDDGWELIGEGEEEEE